MRKLLPFRQSTVVSNDLILTMYHFILVPSASLSMILARSLRKLIAVFPSMDFNAQNLSVGMYFTDLGSIKGGK